MRFRDRDVVVTGAGRGIGRAAVTRFLAEGARVAAIDLEPPGEDDTEHLSWHGFDITDEGAVAAFFAGLRRCDVLVNNAGIPGEGALEALTTAHWNRVFAVNVTAQMLMARAALPRMPAGASIVNLASVAAHLGFAERAAYCASKSAVLGLTRALAVELAGRVRVNCLCPGTVDTPWIARLVGDGSDREERRAAMAERQAIGRLGTPDEIAAAIAFLASHDASFITGSIIMADGGMTIFPSDACPFSGSMPMSASGWRARARNWRCVTVPLAARVFGPPAGGVLGYRSAWPWRPSPDWSGGRTGRSMI